MNARVWLAGLLMAVLPSIVSAQGRIAVVNLEQAILQTDVAQQRLQEFESNEDFASDKSQFDALREELDQLVEICNARTPIVTTTSMSMSPKQKRTLEAHQSGEGKIHMELFQSLGSHMRAAVWQA